MITSQVRNMARPDGKAQGKPEWTEPNRNQSAAGPKSLGNTTKKLRILIADDHDIVRRGIRSLVEARPEWKVCDEARSGHEAVAKSEEQKPDIVILDVSMPELDGLEAARRIKKVSPNSEILILSVHYSDQLIKEILDAGVRGFVVKSDPGRDVIAAVASLASHKPFFTSMATEVMLTNFQRPSAAPSAGMRASRLTSRELEIVQLLSKGKSSKEVASSLEISIKTAETHRANIMRKLDIHSVSELVRYALRNQIIEA
jgi:DNA-binding NarL/FixJ family response regulator